MRFQNQAHYERVFQAQENVRTETMEQMANRLVAMGSRSQAAPDDNLLWQNGARSLVTFCLSRESVGVLADCGDADEFVRCWRILFSRRSERASRRQNKAQDCSLYETRPAATQTHNREIFKAERLFGAHCCCSAHPADKGEKASMRSKVSHRAPATFMNN